MAKTQKVGASGSRNDSRPNGKAGKKTPGRKNTNEKLDPGMLVLMGKGIYQQVSNRAQAESNRIKSAERKSRGRNDED